MVVIDLERLFALPQHAGDLSVGHPVIVAEVEDQPLLERQLQDRLLTERHQRCVRIPPHSSATRLARMRLTSSSEEKSPGLRRRSIVSAVFVAMR